MRNPVVKAKASDEDTIEVFDKDIASDEGGASVEGGAVVLVAVPDAYKVAVQGNAVGICVVSVRGVDAVAVILVIILFSYMY